MCRSRRQRRRGIPALGRHHHLAVGLGLEVRRHDLHAVAVELVLDVGEQRDEDEGAPFTADMIVYTRSKGLYGGVNLDGTVITVDDGRNQAYCGQAATPVDILVTRSVNKPYGARLAQAATSAVAHSH